MFEYWISILFEARDVAHELHLKTKSFAIHIAFGELYEKLQNFNDEFAEVVAGRFGAYKENFPRMNSSFTKNPMDFIMELKSYLTDIRKFVETYNDTSDIINLLDELLAFVNRILFKIENLA